MTTPRAAKPRDLGAELADIKRQLRDLSSLAMGRKISPVFATSHFDQGQNLAAFPTTRTVYQAGSVTVPAGYARAHVMVQVSAGASYLNASIEGSVSVAPVVDGGIGPDVNSGSGWIVVANSFWATVLTGLTAGASIDFGAQIVRASSPSPDPNTCNWHLAASIIFLH